VSQDIGLVSCSGPKERHGPARDFYISQLFKAQFEVAVARHPLVYILSAKYGLVELDAVLDWYDQELGKLKKYDEAWGFNVACHLAARHLRRGPARLTFYAGKKYVEPVRAGLKDFPKWNVTVVEPMKGLEIGERKHWLKEQLG
jgi:hypothetical protein